jgi:hypothetical protein
MANFDHIKTSATTLTQDLTKKLSNVGSAKAINLPSGVSNAIKTGTSQLNGLQANTLQGLKDGTVPSLLVSKGSSLLSTGPTAANSQSNIIPNPLSAYSSFNYIWTLSVLDDAAINFPDETYKKGRLGQIICRNGSGDPENRINTGFGKFDYVIDDMRISHIMGFDKATGNSNAGGFSFKVYEPYSMGLFMQSLQIAAKLNGHDQTYLTAPFLLTVEFMGHIDPNQQNVNQGAITTRHYPFRIGEVDMNVTNGGSVYTIEAYPWNEQAFSDSVRTIKTDITISGSTVQEMLQTGAKSLQKVLNDRYLELKKEGQVAAPDEVVIQFPVDIATSSIKGNSDISPADEGATLDPNAGEGKDIFTKLGVTRSAINATLVQADTSCNEIGRSKMGFDLYRRGDFPFGKDNLVYDEKTNIYTRGDLEINPSESDFKFRQGSDIPNAINQVIMMSDYARFALDQNNIVDGMVKWWRIETHVYNIPLNENIAKTGDKPKLYVYRVVPYLSHVSKVLPPNSVAPGIPELEKQAIKEYNYIYTGKNTDILDFNIKFNAAFYQAFAADANANNEDVKTSAQNSGLANVSQNGAVLGTEKVSIGEGTAETQIGSTGTQIRYDKTEFSSDRGGGGGQEELSTRVARQFMDAVTNGVDLMEVDLKILGDPYFLGDSGMGNYTAGQVEDLTNINQDGSVNYQNGEVHVRLNFRTPIDIKEQTGLYDFGPTEMIQEYSGLYKVYTLESEFSRGMFTQTLNLLRVPMQEVKDKQAPVAGPMTSVESIPVNINPGNLQSLANIDISNPNFLKQTAEQALDAGKKFLNGKGIL